MKDAKAKISINHSSTHCSSPREVATLFAKLIDGFVKELPWKKGAFATLFNSDDFTSDLVEFYPISVGMRSGIDGPEFWEDPKATYVNATHFNINVPFTREEAEERARSLGLQFSWRSSLGLLDVWLDEQVLLELVCVDRPAMAGKGPNQA